MYNILYIPNINPSIIHQHDTPLYSQQISSSQWPFQDPRLGISPQNMARNMVLTYLHFRILKFPLTKISLRIVVAFEVPTPEGRQDRYHRRWSARSLVAGAALVEPLVVSNGGSTITRIHGRWWQLGTMEFYMFPYIGNNNLNWRTRIFSEG